VPPSLIKENEMERGKGMKPGWMKRCSGDNWDA